MKTTLISSIAGRVLAVMSAVVLITGSAAAGDAVVDCNGNGIADQCDLDASSQGCGAYVSLNNAVEGADDCQSAPLIELGRYYRGSTAGKNNDGQASCAPNSKAGSVWYKVKVPATGALWLNMGGTFNAINGYDSVLSIYDSCGGAELGCADDGCAGALSVHAFDSLVSVTGLTHDSTVYIRVSGFTSSTFKNGEGDYLLYVSGEEAPGGCGGNPAGASDDCNFNQKPDECDLREGVGSDCNNNGAMDSCEHLMDCDGNGKADVCEAAVQVTFAANQDNYSDYYGVKGPLKTSNFVTIYDILGMNYSSEIPEPLETANEDYLGPNFYCTSCPGGQAYAPFGLFLGWPRFISGAPLSGGWFQGDGTYHVYDASPSGGESRGRLLMVNEAQCGLPIGEGATGFVAKLDGVGPDSTGSFKGCFSMPLAHLGNPGIEGQTFSVTGQYDADGVFVGKGTVEPCGGWDVYVSGRFIQPGCCADCNENGIGDAADITSGRSADKNRNSVPDECEEFPPVDCNNNGIPDSQELTNNDCNTNGVPDTCETDTDEDGVIDACDGCPQDPQKSHPGVCGCGKIDTDSDRDGTPDCNDNDIEVDCFGVPGGAAAYDRCGVCGGDGQSYLGCFEVDAGSAAFDAEAAVKKQARYAKKLASAKNCKVSKLQIDKLLNYSLNVINTWPATVTQCFNTTYCTDIAVMVNVSAYQDTALELFKLSKQAAKCSYRDPAGGKCEATREECLAAIAKIQRENRMLVNRARRLLSDSLETTLDVPASTSRCCDEIN